MTTVGERDIKPVKSRPRPSTEQLKELREALDFDRHRVGAPGCKVRERAETALWLLEFVEGLFRANETPGNVLHGVLDKVEEEAPGPKLMDPNEISSASRSEALAHIQSILWRDDDGKVDPDKECGADEIGEIVQVLEQHGLAPT